MNPTKMQTIYLIICGHSIFWSITGIVIKFASTKYKASPVKFITISSFNKLNQVFHNITGLISFSMIVMFNNHLVFSLWTLYITDKE